MSDLRKQVQIARSVEQSRVVERPGATGFDTFYASGSWVPTYAGSTTAGVTTYTSQFGTWWRIGSLIFYTVYVNWTAATGTGRARVSLPFTASNVALQSWAVPVWINNVTFANSAPEGIISPNTAFIELYSPLTNAATAAVNIEAVGEILSSGFYSTG